MLNTLDGTLSPNLTLLARERGEAGCRQQLRTRDASERIFGDLPALTGTFTSGGVHLFRSEDPRRTADGERRYISGKQVLPFSLQTLQLVVPGQEAPRFPATPRP